MKRVLLISAALLSVTAAPASAAVIGKARPIILTNGPKPPKLVGAVPEPGTWLTMLAGFGLIGVAIRARREDEVAPAL
jgi:hypothetical protein